MNDVPVYLSRHCCVLLSPYVSEADLSAIDSQVNVYGCPETAVIMHTRGYEVTPCSLERRTHSDGTDRFRLVKGSNNASCIVYHYNTKTLYCGNCTLSWQWWKKYAKSQLRDVWPRVQTVSAKTFAHKVPNRDDTIQMLYTLWQDKGTLEIVDPLAKSSPLWGPLSPYLSVKADTVFVPEHDRGQHASNDERIIVVDKPTNNGTHVVYLEDALFFANRHDPTRRVETPSGTLIFYQEHASEENLQDMLKDDERLT